MASFGNTDFRGNLGTVTVPTLVIHGDADRLAPFEGPGHWTHTAIPHSELVVVHRTPHRLNVSHAGPFNKAPLDFVGR